MTIEHAGRSFTVFLAPLLAHFGNEPRAKRPQFLLGCERCGTSCSSTAPGASCKCCKQYKTRTAGGTLNFPTLSGPNEFFAYDPDAPKHVRIARFADVVTV